MWVGIREHNRSSAFAHRHQEQGLWDYPLTWRDLSIAELLGARVRVAVWRKGPGRSFGLGRRTQATLGELARNQPGKWNAPSLSPYFWSPVGASYWQSMAGSQRLKEPRLLSPGLGSWNGEEGRRSVKTGSEKQMEDIQNWIWYCHQLCEHCVLIPSKSTLSHLTFSHSSSLCSLRATHDEEVIVSVSLTNTQGTSNSSWPHEPLTYLGERQACQQIIAIQCAR